MSVSPGRAFQVQYRLMGHLGSGARTQAHRAWPGGTLIRSNLVLVPLESTAGPEEAKQKSPERIQL